MAVRRIGWFSTGRGPGSRALLRSVTGAIADGLPIEIAYVFCNREYGEDPATDEFLDLANGLKLPLITYSSVAFRKRAGGKVVRKGDPLPRWRLEYDDEVIARVEPYDVSVGLLAGYMLIFGPRACEKLALLNLHPAAPGGPIGIWQDIVWQLIDQRAEQSGITIFRAVPEVDTGPPISFCTYPLRGGRIDVLWRRSVREPVEVLRETVGEKLPLFQEIRQRGLEREQPLIVETLRALADGEANPAGGEPIDLSEVVEERLLG
jgi:folate-dependent phosphoribosylglycinamide formyltransferase PurN